MEILILLLLLIFLCWKKNAHYSDIMLDALTVALCPKLWRHNVSNSKSYAPLSTQLYLMFALKLVLLLREPLDNRERWRWKVFNIHNKTETYLFSKKFFLKGKTLQRMICTRHSAYWWQHSCLFSVICEQNTCILFSLFLLSYERNGKRCSCATIELWIHLRARFVRDVFSC